MTDRVAIRVHIGEVVTDHLVDRDELTAAIGEALRAARRARPLDPSGWRRGRTELEVLRATTTGASPAQLAAAVATTVADALGGQPT